MTRFDAGVTRANVSVTAHPKHRVQFHRRSNQKRLKPEPDARTERLTFLCGPADLGGAFARLLRRRNRRKR